MKRYRAAVVIGARPQFVKAAALVEAWRAWPQRKRLDLFWIHTGQHYDYGLSKIFFREFSLPEPDVHLAVGSKPHASQTAEILERTEAVLLDKKPDMVVVFGDTNSTLAGALAASKVGIPVAHIEAGLRSFNRGMPEEINRTVTDRLSDLLFCPTKGAVDQLRREGVTRGVFLTGDVMADLVRSRIRAIRRKAGQPYYLATIHRNLNTDVPGTLRKILTALDRFGEPVVFPVHPRTRAAIRADRRSAAIVSRTRRILFVEPVSYHRMLELQANAAGVITDSGGIQKEAFLLGTPCVTLRTETEWPETVRAGLNILCAPDAAAMRRAFRKMTGRKVSGPGPYGAGDAARRILVSVLHYLERKRK